MSLSNATVRLVRGSTITAKIKSDNGQIQSTSNVTLTTAAVASQNRLDNLADVVEQDPVDGSTLIYRASDDKYVVQQLTLDNVTGNLDGGTF